MIKIEHNFRNTFISEYSLSKKLGDLGIILECDTDAIFDQETYDSLLSSATKGDQADSIDIIINCGGDTVNYDGFLRHTDGKFNLKTCVAEKKINFKNVYECLDKSEYNIFDATPYDTEILAGVLIKDSYIDTKQVLFPPDYAPTLEEILSYFNPIVPLGMAIESIEVQATPNIIFGIDPITGYEVRKYVGYDLSMIQKYIMIHSATKLNDDWIAHPLGGYFYNPDLLPKAVLGNGFYSYYNDDDNQSFIGVVWLGGRYNQFKDGTISNTYNFNEVLQNVFKCTGKDIVSDFFGIDSIGDAPNNNAYDYAIRYMQELRIVQSYDIIRESAKIDSFGISGKFDVKKMITDISKLFNLILYYDKTLDVIRFEHITFLNKKGIDFVANAYDYEFNGEVELNKDIVNLERWLMAGESETDGFYKCEIDYKNKGINEKENEINTKMEYILTDVINMINNEKYNNSKYEKMFFLLSTSSGAINGFNNPLSMRNIIKNLHNINRPLLRGWIDGVSTIFAGFSMGFSGVLKMFASIKTFDLLNPLNSLKTNIGTFVIEEMTFEKETITFKIKK